MIRKKRRILFGNAAAKKSLTAMLDGYTDGLAFNFTLPGTQVVVKTSGVLAFYRAVDFFQNSAGPVMIDSDGLSIVAADRVLCLTTQFPASASSGTIFAEVKPDALGAFGAFALNNNATTNRVDARTTNGATGGVVSSGGVTSALFDTSAQTWTAGVWNRVVVSYALNDFGMVVNGGTEITDVAGAAPTSVSHFKLGHLDVGSNGLAGRIKGGLYVQPALSGGQMQALSIVR